MPNFTSYFRFFISCFLLLCSNVFIFGQSNPDEAFNRYSFLQKNMTTPPSAEAASLGEYGQFNVSKYSGRANISVPIYSVSGKSLQVPIALSYDHSGLKITSPSTWVGMNWNLSAFGVITKSAIGLPDTQENYYDKADSLRNTSSFTDEIREQKFLELCAKGEIEPQPDAYFLSLPNGISAKFYINPDQEIVQREFQGLRITPNFVLINGRTDVNRFTVTDLSGTQYIFELKEETTFEIDDIPSPLAPFPTLYDYYSTWYLTEMRSAVNNERIIFEYHTAGLGEVYGIPINPDTYNSATYLDNGNTMCCGPANTPQYSSSSTDMNQIKDRSHLSKIKYVLGTDTIETVEFISSPDTLTLDDVTDRQLDTIRVFRGKDASRAVLDFVLSYYPENDPQFVGRLTLKSVQEFASNGSVSKPPYEFSYNQGNIPSSTLSNQQDHWGYFNNNNGGQLIPNISQHSALGSNRNPNISTLQNGILQEVQYPTGGFTCYEYEKHEADIPTSSSDISGLRIRSIEHYDDVGVLLLKRSYRYVKSDGTTSSGIFHAGLDYESPSTRRQCFVGTTGGNDPCVNTVCPFNTISATNRSFLGSLQGDVVGYSRVEEIIQSNTNSTNSGKTICFYKNGTSLASMYDQVGYELLTKKEVYDANNEIITRMEYTYSLDTMDTGNAYNNDAVEDSLDTQSFVTFQGIADSQQDNKRWLCERNTGSYEWNTEDKTNDLDYKRCDCFASKFQRGNARVIRRFWIYTKRKIATQFFYTGGTETGRVSTTQYYVYGDRNHTQPTRSIIVNSDGYEYETQTEFVADQPDMTPGKRGLELNNRWATPYKEIRYINQQEIYRTRLEYNNFGRVLPNKLYEEFPNKAEFLSEVMSYDGLGNLNQGYRYYEQPIPNMDTLAAYQPMSMIWSHYGAALGARVQNAEVGEIAYTSFENSDETTQGNWIIPNPSTNIQYDSTDARTGKGYFRASGGTQSITKLLRPGKYILSYYKKIGDNISITGATILRSKTAGNDAQSWQYIEHEIEVPSSANVSVEVANADRIDELRVYPHDALMTTYAYNKDTRQMLSSADENAISTRMEYDGLLRLKGTRNFDNHYLQTIDYEYNAQFPSNIKNAIKTWNVLKENQLTTSMVKSLASGEVIKNAQYFDNIGRPIQSVGIGQSPAQNDIVNFQVYDEFGRVIDKYLPYTATTNNGAYRANFLAEQQSFITAQYGAGESTFGKAIDTLERSPLNRIFKSYAQGSDWIDKPKEVRYRSNSANDVRDFFQANTFYPANSLTKTIQLDEDNKQTITYTDKIGRTIMIDNEGSRTYYLYDLQGLLIQVIQPTGSNMGHSNTSLIYTDASIADRSFTYTYDNEYRLASKKIPGTGNYQYFYDDADQLVLTVDPKGFKLFTKYDILGRPIMTGKYKGSATPNLSAVIYESPSQSEACYYTNDQAFPTDGNIDIYTINYYDTHDFDQDQSDEVSYQDGTLLGFSNTNYPYLRGKATGSKTAILPEDTLQAPSTYLGSYLFYDKFSRVIHTQSDNHLQGQDIVWNEYNYPGWLLKSYRDHTAIVENCNKAVTIHQRHNYDHIGRLLRTFHQVNNEPEQLICEKSYNERDELRLKRLAVNQMTDGALQDVNYEYNIRRWLTKINDVDNIGNDLFAMDLKYTENIADNFNNAINYNGNITAIEWRFQSDANSKIYSYEYDDLNRLETAVYGERNGMTYLNKNRYNSQYEYDANGNIRELRRNGFNGVGYTRIDDLLYTYFDDGRLDKILESTSENYGFKTLEVDKEGSYQYDANGNMISDEHKNIGVSYNHLNLPTNVQKTNDGSITWSYDATGKKLSKQVTRDSLLIIDNPILDDEYNANLITSTGNVTSGSNVTFIASDTIVLKPGFTAKHDFVAKIGPNLGKIRHYCNGIEYFDGEMEAIYHEAGRVFFDGTTPVYEYTLSDYLGNTRVVFKDDGSSSTQEIQKNDYYSFGLEMEEEQNAYSYKFNGLEKNNEISLEWDLAEFRTYDPAKARWEQIDPFSETAYDWSTYRFGYNNPILYIDPLGLKEIELQDLEGNWHTISSENPDLTVLYQASPDSGKETEQGESPDDKIYLNSDGIVTSVVRDDGPNRFFDENGNELTFNDAEEEDKDFFENSKFDEEDRIYYPISHALFLKYIQVGGLAPMLSRLSGDLAGAYAQVGLASYGRADFSYSVLKKNYSIEEFEIDRRSTRRVYDSTAAYFRFGSSNVLYNWFDAGNFLWGGWMGLNTFTETEMVIGSNLNEVLQLRMGDSAGDQRAIKAGHNLFIKGN